VFEAQILLDEGKPNEAAARAFSAMLVAARALARQKNENLGDAPDEVVREFKTQLVDTKLFWDQYAHGKFSQYFFKAYEQPAQNPNKETAHQLVEEAQLFVDAAYQYYSKSGNLAAAGANAPS
jgi:sulfite reductase (ferredoxin)